jgi:hypothetical protein
VGKGKGKKGRRGGRPNRNSGRATTSAAPAVADRPAASAVATAAAMNPFSGRASSQSSSKAASEGDATFTSWSSALGHFAAKLGVYALFGSGVYWLAAAYFAWYGELHWLVGPVWMGLLGLISIALGWYLLGPEVPFEVGPTAKRLSAEDRRKQGFEHMQRGTWWLIGALAVTLITYNLAAFSGGGKYIVTVGAMLYGISQIIRGAVQVYGAQRD